MPMQYKGSVNYMWNMAGIFFSMIHAINMKCSVQNYVNSTHGNIFDASYLIYNT